MTAFAIRHIDFGEDAGGWKHYGLDIDHVATTPDSSPSCQRAAFAPRDTQQDGDDGIDNSFGANVVPLIVSLLGTDAHPAIPKLEASLSLGESNPIVSIDRLGPEPNASPVSGAMLVGAASTAPPRWDGTDVWPVDDVSLSDAGSERLRFGTGYITNRVFVGQPPSGRGTLSIGAMNGAALTVPITHVQVVFPLDQDGNGGSAGVISGIIPLEDFVASVVPLLQRVTPAMCSGSVADTIIVELRQSADILIDGAVDPSRPCDGISIGLGFDARRVILGAPVAVAGPPTPCVDAGDATTDGGSD